MNSISEQEYEAALDERIAELNQRKIRFAQYKRLKVEFAVLTPDREPETLEELLTPPEEADTAEQSPTSGHRLPGSRYTYPRETMMAIACMNPASVYTRKRMIKYLRKLGHYKDRTPAGNKTAYQSVGTMFSLLNLNGFMEPVAGEVGTFKATDRAVLAFVLAEGDIGAVFAWQGLFKNAHRQPVGADLAAELARLGFPDKHIPVPRGMSQVRPGVDTGQAG